MQCVGNYKKILVLLAITAIFSTVAPVRVFAENASLITNVVYSSQNTGGISVNGADGQDGERGQDGKNGESGQDGADGKAGGNGASVVNPEDSSSVSVIHTATSSKVGAQANVESTNSVDSSFGALSALQEALFSLRLMLVTYVSELF